MASETQEVRDDPYGAAVQMIAAGLNIALDLEGPIGQDEFSILTSVWRVLIAQDHHAAALVDHIEAEDPDTNAFNVIVSLLPLLTPLSVQSLEEVLSDEYR
jgi:hypothetical protein